MLEDTHYLGESASLAACYFNHLSGHEFMNQTSFTPHIPGAQVPSSESSGMVHQNHSNQPANSLPHHTWPSLLGERDKPKKLYISKALCGETVSIEIDAKWVWGGLDQMSDHAKDLLLSALIASVYGQPGHNYVQVIKYPFQGWMEVQFPHQKQAYSAYYPLYCNDKSIGYIRIHRQGQVTICENGQRLHPAISPSYGFDAAFSRNQSSALLVLDKQSDVEDKVPAPARRKSSTALQEQWRLDEERFSMKDEALNDAVTGIMASPDGLWDAFTNAPVTVRQESSPPLQEQRRQGKEIPPMNLNEQMRDLLEAVEQFRNPIPSDDGDSNGVDADGAS